LQNLGVVTASLLTNLIVNFVIKCLASDSSLSVGSSKKYNIEMQERRQCTGKKLRYNT